MKKAKLIILNLAKNDNVCYSDTR